MSAGVFVSLVHNKKTTRKWKGLVIFYKARLFFLSSIVIANTTVFSSILFCWIFFSCFGVFLRLGWFEHVSKNIVYYDWNSIQTAIARVQYKYV